MSEWVDLGDSAGLVEHGRCLIKAGGIDIAVFDIEGQLHAVEDSCPHGGASLCSGKLDQQQVQCRAHGLRFRLEDGRLVGTAEDGPPGPMSLQVFAVRVVDGRIQMER